MQGIDYKNKIEQLYSGLQYSRNATSCSFCGGTIDDFNRLGRFGCPNCYSDLIADVLPIAERLHFSNFHVGKIPQPLMACVPMQIDGLRVLAGVGTDVDNLEFNEQGISAWRDDNETV